MQAGLPFQTAYTHVHVYFTPETRAVAESLRARIAANFAGRAHIGRLIDQPIGPHPLPMFEVDFSSALATELVPFLEAQRGDLSVLVHPVSGEEVQDHTVSAVWLGRRLELKVDFLEAYMARQKARAG